MKVELSHEDLIVLSMLVHGRVYDVQKLLDNVEENYSAHPDNAVLEADRDYVRRLRLLASRVDKYLRVV